MEEHLEKYKEKIGTCLPNLLSYAFYFVIYVDCFRDDFSIALSVMLC